jgi:DNA-directed RNA polymerase specialized sigma24 family protein
MVDLLERLPRYDATRSRLNTFIARVIERKVVCLLRHHGAAKRSRDREECSLNDPVLDAEVRIVDRHEVTPHADDGPRRLRDLEHDVAAVLAGLPEILRAVAVGLLNGSVSSASLDLGLSRGTVRRHVQELRRRFENAGLRGYL